jgi:hypothetical protein
VFALPSVLDICRGLAPGDFERLVMPELKRLLGLCISDSRAAADERDRQERQPERGQERVAPVPPQLSYVILRSMDMLLAKAPSGFQVHSVSIIVSSLYVLPSCIMSWFEWRSVTIWFLSSHAVWRLVNRSCANRPSRSCQVLSHLFSIYLFDCLTLLCCSWLSHVSFLFCSPLMQWWSW